MVLKFYLYNHKKFCIETTAFSAHLPNFDLIINKNRITFEIEVLKFFFCHAFLLWTVNKIEPLAEPPPKT